MRKITIKMSFYFFIPLLYSSIKKIALLIGDSIPENMATVVDRFNKNTFNMQLEFEEFFPYFHFAIYQPDCFIRAFISMQPVID